MGFCIRHLSWEKGTVEEEIYSICIGSLHTIRWQYCTPKALLVRLTISQSLATLTTTALNCTAGIM